MQDPNVAIGKALAGNRKQTNRQSETNQQAESDATADRSQHTNRTFRRDGRIGIDERML